MAKDIKKSRGALRSKIVLAGISFALSLLLAEVCLRLLFYVPLLPGDMFIESNPLDSGRSARRWLVPGWRGRHKTQEYDVIVRINRHGLRENADVPYHKPKDTFRILGLGDSFTFGQGVELHETFGKLLQKRLSSDLHRTVQFINAGVPSYGTCDELDFLQQEGWRYQPDVVLVQFFYNDTQDNIVRRTYQVNGGALRPIAPLEQRTARRTEAIPGVLAPTMFGVAGNGAVRHAAQTSPQMNFLLRYSQLARLARLIFARHQSSVLADTSLLQQRERRTLQLTSALMLEIGRQARLHHVPLVVLLVPEPDLEFAETPGRPAAKNLKAAYHPMIEALQASGFTVVDLLPPLRASGFSRTQLFFKTDRHLTPQGHQVVSNAVASALEQEISQGER